MFDVLPPSPGLLAPEDLIDELESALAERDRLEARISSLVSLVGTTSAYERDGYPSVTALLKHRMLLHPGEALRFVSRARGLAEAPGLAAAYADAVLSGAQVDILLQGQAMAPVGYAEEEETLIELARGMPVRELRRLVDYWLDREVPDEMAAGRELTREWRSVYLRRDGDMMRLSGWVDIEAGELLRAALDPGPPAQDDTRSTPARRADVLMDIVNGATDRPGLIVHVSYETLTAAAPGVSETEHGTFLTADEVRRLACDANLTRVVFGPDSRPLDVGRTRRLVTPALRAAVSARDLGCVFPGCDRPSSWCDVHHIEFLARDAGETRVDNLIILCRHHHTLVHQGGWSVEGTPGGLRFLRPGGSQLGDIKPEEVRAPAEPPPPRIDFRELVAVLPRLRGP